MPPTMQSLGINHLSLEDRLSLVHEIWDSIVQDTVVPHLTEDMRREIERRLANYRANPDSALPWEEVKARLLARKAR